MILRGGPDFASLRLYDQAGNEVPITLPQPFHLFSENGQIYLRAKLPVRLDIRLRPKGAEDSYEPVECPFCKRVFMPTHGSQVYCSRKCGQDMSRYQRNPGIKPRGRNKRLIA